jgi:type IV pilus assembly protein PilB
LNVADLKAATASAILLVPEKVVRRHIAFPIRANDRQITVAVGDPSDLNLEQALGFVSGREPVFEIAPPSAILKVIDERYAPDRLVERLVGRIGTDMADQVHLVDDAEPEAVSTEELDALPVVKLTNMILHEAVRAGASDIHLEPGRDGGTVRLRVDGVLRTIMQVPTSVLSRVVSRIKIMGKLDIADRLRPRMGELGCRSRKPRSISVSRRCQPGKPRRLSSGCWTPGTSAGWKRWTSHPLSSVAFAASSVTARGSSW